MNSAKMTLYRTLVTENKVQKLQSRVGIKDLNIIAVSGLPCKHSACKTSSPSDLRKTICSQREHTTLVSLLQLTVVSNSDLCSLLRRRGSHINEFSQNDTVSNIGNRG